MKIIIGMGILFVIGVVVGTQIAIAWQFVAIIIFILYMNSGEVAAMEIGSVLPLILGVSFFGGCLVGDISWLFQTEAWNTSNIGNPFLVK
jgi:hypothetical protein